MQEGKAVNLATYRHKAQNEKAVMVIIHAVANHSNHFAHLAAAVAK